MSELLLLLIFIIAALSCVSYLYCWHDIKSGRPHIITLRQITGIMDRNRLNSIYGPPQTGYYYPLAADTIRILLNHYRTFYICECAADAVCMLGVWRYMQQLAHPAGLALFIILALTCQGVNIIYSLWLVHKWRDQLREELENTPD